MLPFISPIVNSSRILKFALLVAFDVALITIGLFISAWLVKFDLVENSQPTPAVLFAISYAIALPVFSYFGLYRAIIRYIGFRAIVAISNAVFIYSLISGLIFGFFYSYEFVIPLAIANGLSSLFLVGGSRMLMRFVLSSMGYGQSASTGQVRYLIYGAGDAGQQIGRAMLGSPRELLIGFVDDNKKLHGREILGVPIIAPKSAGTFIVKNDVSTVLLALPSATKSERIRILDFLRPLHVRVKVLPSVSDLLSSKLSMSDIHDVDIDDLLGRNSTPVDRRNIDLVVRGEVVLVTGAGGSIGSELCRQILSHYPRVLVLYELNEFSLYKVHKELLQLLGKLEESNKSGNHHIRLLPQIIPLLGSVDDSERFSKVVDTWRPSMLYHAAAYKHVPMVEHNFSQGVLNNVFGTLIAAKIAIQFKVKNFVFISTDKAVRPTSVMGATKRLAEMCLQALSVEKNPDIHCVSGDDGCLLNQTHFSMVRFGNVLESSGSVVPLFNDQIKSGGPITLTHPEVTRYFMSIPEAAQLVLHSGALFAANRKHGSLAESKQADVYLLDMGSPVKVKELARRMVELSGLSIKDELNPEGDIEISIIGLRPGEKLYEELLISGDPQPTEHPRITRASEEFILWPDLQCSLINLKKLIQEDHLELAQAVLQELVSGYQPNKRIVDWLYLQKQSTL